MYCPFCSKGETKVIDSRLAGEGQQVRRRRECLDCGERFTTFESAELLMPRASEEQVRWFSDLMRTTTQPEIAARILESFGAINVRALLPRVKVPTMVVHARGDARIPFEQGRLLATEIPGARFVTLESRNHILLPRDPAWAAFVREVRRFLLQDTPARARATLAAAPAP